MGNPARPALPNTPASSRTPSTRWQELFYFKLLSQKSSLYAPIHCSFRTGTKIGSSPRSPVHLFKAGDIRAGQYSFDHFSIEDTEEANGAQDGSRQSSIVPKRDETWADVAVLDPTGRGSAGVSEQFIADVIKSLHPVGATEEELARQFATANWKLRRIERWEVGQAHGQATSEQKQIYQAHLATHCPNKSKKGARIYANCKKTRRATLHSSFKLPACPRTARYTATRLIACFRIGSNRCRTGSIEPHSRTLPNGLKNLEMITRNRPRFRKKPRPRGQ